MHKFTMCRCSTTVQSTTQHTAWARITLYTTHQKTAQPARPYTYDCLQRQPPQLVRTSGIVNRVNCPGIFHIHWRAKHSRRHFQQMRDLLHPALLKSTIMMTIMDLPDHSTSSTSISSELSLFSFKSIISTDIP